MPLLKRKPYSLEPPPRDLKPDEPVYQVRHTKEIFRDYEEYLRRMHLYRKRQWTCKVTGKQNLTYEEALVSERRATEQVQHFPKEFMGPVLSIVQFSPLRLDELVDRIYKEFKDQYVQNEEVLGKAAESFSACKILKVLQHPTREERHYEVGWLDEHGKRFGTSTESAKNLLRKKYPFTRALLKAFIRESAVTGPSRNSSFWCVKNKLAKKYKIPIDPPANIATQESNPSDRTTDRSAIAVEVVENGGHNTRKRKKKEEDSAPLKGKSAKKSTTPDANSAVKVTKSAKKVKVSQEAPPVDELPKGKRIVRKVTPPDEKPAVVKKASSKKGKPGVTKGTGSDEKPPRPGKKVVKKEAAPAPPPPPPPPIKYPIEDTLVKPGPDDPVLPKRPIPSTDFVLPMESLGNLLMIWDFCTSFSKALHLSPFSLEEFEKSLDYREGNAPLIAEILFALLRTNLSDPALWEEFVKKRKRKSELSLNTWKDDLCDMLHLTSYDTLGDYLPSIRQGYYRQFDVTVKLQILRDLVDRSLHSSIIRSQIDENIGEHQALCAKKREEELEIVKKRKLEKMKQMPNGTSDGGVMDVNGKSGDNDVVDEAGCSADEKDIGRLGINGDLKDEMMGEEDGQSVGWKTKGKRKLAGNQSPISANGSVKKEEQVDNGTLSKSKQGSKYAEDEKKSLEDSKIGQDKKKDPPAERKSAEQIALENQKRQDQLDRELEKRSIRTSPLGNDRDYNVYWFFPREGRVFVENEDSTKWGYYSAKEEFEELLGSLNPKGVRERFLQKQLEKHFNKISNVLLRRSKEIAQKIAMEEVAVRRSVRVRSAPRLPPFLAYVNKLRPS
ncbi:unnamed protein product [Calypogeia fissa]